MLAIRKLVDSRYWKFKAYH